MSNTTINNRLGLCSWSLHPQNPDDLISQLKEVNLDVIQLALMPLINDSAWSGAKAKLDDAGIKIASGMVGTIGEDYSTLETIAKTGGVVPDEHWEKNYQRFEKAAALAEEIGLSKVSFHAGFIPHDKNNPTFEKLTKRLTQCADLFAKHGAKLLLETGQETGEDLLAFLNDLNHNNLYVNFDPANIILYSKGDPVQAVKLLLPKLDQVHIKDALHPQTPGTWGKEVAIGEGDVDWHSFFEVLKEGEYTGDFIIEREAGEQRIADIQTAIRFLHNAMM